MPFDPDSISGAVRQRFVETGRNFGSDRTFAQGSETLKQAKANAEVLKGHGTGPSKIGLLEEVLGHLQSAGADRDQTRTGEGVATRERHAAERDGKAARAQARSVLSGSLTELLLLSDEAAQKEVDQILHQTDGSGSHLPTLSRQLALLSGGLALPAVAPVVAGAGGPEAAAAVEAARTRVDAVLARGASHSGRTPQETEKLDLLDGIVVDLCRQFRKAARSAARSLGTPALAELFDLDLLYGRPPKKAARPEPQVA